MNNAPQIQYLGFQPKARGRDYSYRVLNPADTTIREFTFTISHRCFLEQNIPYQDAAAICYQKLQKELSAEPMGQPLPRHYTLSKQELDDYREKHRPAKKRV
jgi:hypothetical protein